MSEITADNSEARVSWQESRYRWAAIPGWSLSLLFHALFLLLLSTQLKSCGGVMSGESEGEYRTVGLVMKESDRPNFSENTQQNDSEIEQETALDQETEVQEVPEKPPIEMALPQIGSNTIGPGSVAPAIGLQNPAPSKVQAAPSALTLPSQYGLGDGKIRFMDAVDSGTNFVYVIDCSGSMGDFDALEFAKAELLASLQALTPKQKFQVIFYSERAASMNLPGSGTQMVAGTDVNRNKAKQQIKKARPMQGTRHMPALLAALRYEPDVIFLLTDAQDVYLQRNELEKIKRMNRSNARIHCIEFGKGKELKGDDNSFKQLARQNSGTHSYRDVTRLGQKK
jgi:hypothetical protein